MCGCVGVCVLGVGSECVGMLKCVLGLCVNVGKQ